jgi:hypothetical protein
MVLLFAGALAVPSARSQLLALATLAAAVWIGWDGLRDDGRGPRARLVMAVALLLLAALPALLLAFDNGLWVAPPTFAGLDGALALWSIGIAAIAVGSRSASLVRPRRTEALIVTPATQRGPQRLAIVGVLVVVCLAVFVHKVGGPIAYLKNLNNSAASNFGLTYFIWGISFAKYAAFAYLAESWARGRHPRRIVMAATVVAFVLVLFLGSRLLLLVALIQLLVLYGAFHPITHRFKLVLGVAAILGVVAFLVIGEYRRWEDVPSPRPSFPSYFVNTSLPKLPRTYVNDYADAVRLSTLARRVVPSQAPYEDGKELLRILLQPIPGTLRPTISTAPALERTFTSGHKNGNALPVPVEGYIEFGFAGVIAFSLLLGLAIGVVDRLGPFAPDVGWLTASIAAGTGLVIIFRGSLHEGIALALIDILGFLIAHRILFRRAPQGAGVLVAASGDTNAEADVGADADADADADSDAGPTLASTS